MMKDTRKLNEGILLTNHRERKHKPALIGYADLDLGRVLLAMNISENICSGTKEYLFTVIPWKLTVRCEEQIILRPVTKRTTKKGIHTKMEGSLSWCGSEYDLEVSVIQKPKIGIHYLNISFRKTQKGQ